MTLLADEVEQQSESRRVPSQIGVQGRKALRFNHFFWIIQSLDFCRSRDDLWGDLREVRFKNSILMIERPWLPRFKSRKACTCICKCVCILLSRQCERLIMSPGLSFVGRCMKGKAINTQSTTCGYIEFLQMHRYMTLPHSCQKSTGCMSPPPQHEFHVQESIGRRLVSDAVGAMRSSQFFIAAMHAGRNGAGMHTTILCESKPTLFHRPLVAPRYQ